eukprot:9014775-Pyramimonas_sp.AAC.1
MQQALGVLRRTVFASRRLLLSHKLTYIHKLCTPHLLYNASVWPQLLNKQASMLENRYLLPFREASGLKFDGLPRNNVAGHRLLSAVNQAPLEITLRLRRLRLIPRLLQAAPVALLSLLDEAAVVNSSWTSL